MSKRETKARSKRKTRTSQSFMQGALVLTLGAIIVKIIGAVFKIPLGNVIAETGMGYFSIAYTFYLPIYTLATAGFPSAISRQVSENMALGNFKDVRKIKKAVSKILIISGILGTFVMFLGGFIYTYFMDEPQVIYSIVALAPSILFCCVMAIYRGYNEGMRNMVPTAVSQIIEALGKLVLGLGMAIGVVKYAESQWNATGKFLGTAYDSAQEAVYASFPYASAGAILGITLGSMLGMIYIIIRQKMLGDGITKAELANAPEARDNKDILRTIYRIGIPIALGVLVMNVTQFIDTSTILGRLKDIDASFLRENYDGLISEKIPDDDIPSFLLGSYNYALNLFNLIPTITQALGISVLPALAAAWAAKNQKSVTTNINSVMKMTILIAAPCGFGMIALARPILQMLYPGKPGAEIAAPILVVLGLAVLFASFLTPVNSMLQAIGKQDTPVKLMLLGMTIKLVVNYTLVGIPELNIAGAPWGTLSCYMFIVLCSLVILLRHSKVKTNIMSVFGKPIIAGAMCGVAAYASYGIMSRYISDKISTVAAIGVAGIVYVIALFAIKGLTKEDMLLFPKGEKIVKVLEKSKLIR